MKISELLKAWRKQEDIDLRTLAVEIGVSHESLARIENGKGVNGRTVWRLMLWLFDDEKGNVATQGRKPSHSKKGTS